MAEPTVLPERLLQAPVRLALVGTHPPTPCGIATFTRSLRKAVLTAASENETIGLATIDVIRVVHHPSGATREEVVAEWVGGDPVSVREAIEVAKGYDCVVIQHEFGIYGADDGEDVVGFVAGLEVPSVVVFHTVLPSPSDCQRRIVERLVALASLAVVQSGSARTRLLANHVVDHRRVRVIPHGAAPNLDGPPGIEVTSGVLVEALARAGAADLLWYRVGDRYLTLLQELDDSRKLIGVIGAGGTS